MTRPPSALPLAVRRAIIAHARNDAPRECCGFLIGRARTVLFSLPMRNVDRRPAVRYRIDDREHIALRRRLRDDGLEILGVYHSHPEGPAAPSPTDVAEAHYPDWIFAIIGLGGRRARVRAFRISNGSIKLLGG